MRRGVFVQGRSNTTAADPEPQGQPARAAASTGDSPPLESACDGVAVDSTIDEAGGVRQLPRDLLVPAILRPARGESAIEDDRLPALFYGEHRAAHRVKRSQMGEKFVEGKFVLMRPVVGCWWGVGGGCVPGGNAQKTCFIGRLAFYI